MKNNSQLRELIKESILEVKKEQQIRSLIRETIDEILSEEEVDEAILGKIGAAFGAFNEDAIKKAEGKLKTGNIESVQGKKANPDIVKGKLSEFENYKSLYEKGDDKGTEIFKQIVKHINTNNNVLYSTQGGTFKSGASYGKEGGTAAGAGGGA